MHNFHLFYNMHFERFTLNNFDTSVEDTVQQRDAELGGRSNMLIENHTPDLGKFEPQNVIGHRR